MAGQQVGAAEEAEEERHDGVGYLLGAVGVDVDQAEPGSAATAASAARRGTEAEDQLPGAEPPLRARGRNASEVRSTAAAASTRPDESAESGACSTAAAPRAPPAPSTGPPGS